MTVGTKSVLFGVHCFLIHPFWVALAWTRLYGFPFDPRLWFAFFLHDIGYVGKPNMDGPEGETHPELGGAIMRRLFGSSWGDFTQHHSRYYAKLVGAEPSKLCWADKYAFILEPAWFYIPRAKLSGELREYVNPKSERNLENGAPSTEGSPYVWHAGVRQNWLDVVRANTGVAV
jgi:hypothetical protein